jgi:dihydrofolate synthase / folylpolyglutamate synthase
MIRTSVSRRWWWLTGLVAIALRAACRSHLRAGAIWNEVPARSTWHAADACEIAASLRDSSTRVGHCCGCLVDALAQALASIYFRVPRGVQLGLGDVMRACASAGHPQLAFPVVHIGGTNGKGSVAAMVASAMRAAGYRVGLFTSPHLVRFAERIQIDSEPIARDPLVDALTQAVEIGATLSFFETTFLAAMLAFRDARVDVAVLEVGLGGRLDATNVVERPLATAVTRVAFDHMDKLGRTIEEISHEKASIAKTACPMVLGPMPEKSERVARDTCSRRGASLILSIGSEVGFRRAAPGEAHVSVPSRCEPLVLRPRLAGDHQLQNAAVAATLCWLASRSLPRLTADVVSSGIASAQWPARLETIHDGFGPVLVDAAHNPDGAEAVVRYLGEMQAQSQCSHRERALVFGAVADKSWNEMLSILTPQADHRFYVEPGGRESAPVGQMAAQFGGEPMGSVADALCAARSAVGPGGLVVVAGSIFLAGAVRAHLMCLDRDPPVAL